MMEIKQKITTLYRMVFIQKHKGGNVTPETDHLVPTPTVMLLFIKEQQHLLVVGHMQDLGFLMIWVLM